MDISKNELRKQYRKKRNLLSETQRHTESERVCGKLLDSEQYRNADVVFCYVSYGSEFETSSLIEAAFLDNKIVAVPKMIGNEMIFCRVYPDSEYQPNCFGIMEPVDAVEVHPQDFISVLMVLPGLCFDEQNGRIGYGGGFYDRYIAKYKLNAKFSIVALALSCQYYSGNIPMEVHDVRPDLVIFP